MKIGILVDILDEHSGARAVPMLARAMSVVAPEDEFVILAAQNLLSLQTKESFPANLKAVVFNKSLLISFDLWKKIRGEKIRLISAHCSLRLLLTARLSGARVVRTDYGTQFPSLNNSFYSWRSGIIPDITNYIGDVWVYFRDYLKFVFSHENIGISQDNALKAKKLYGRKMGFIYLGADDVEVLPNLKKSEGRVVRILSVSRFVPYKGFHILIEAFKKVDRKYAGLELVLIGGQADRLYWDFLKKSAAGRNNINILLNPDDRVLVDYFSRSQLYASGTRWEAFGLPFLEASLYGLPTLGFNFFGPAREIIIDGETGILANNLTDFQVKLEKLIADPGLRQKLGENGQKFASRFTWEKTARNYLKVFKKS